MIVNLVIGIVIVVFLIVLLFYIGFGLEGIILWKVIWLFKDIVLFEMNFIRMLFCFLE